MSVFIHGPQRKTAKGSRGIPSWQRRAGRGRWGEGGRTSLKWMFVSVVKLQFMFSFSFLYVIYLSFFSKTLSSIHLFVYLSLYFRNSPSGSASLNSDHIDHKTSAQTRTGIAFPTAISHYIVNHHITSYHNKIKLN